MDKDKLKGMLKISERDKKLLIVVMAVLIILPKNASATISGSAYAGTGSSTKGTALTINEGASITMAGGYFVCGGNIEANNNSGLSVNNTSLWAKNINVADGVTTQS